MVSCRRRNARASKKANRRQSAQNAQNHLAGILSNPRSHPAPVLDTAAVHLVKTSRRHRLPLPPAAKETVCRKCWSHHVHSTRFRVRIKHGQRIKTCLKCGSVRRFGGGPKHHRHQPRWSTMSTIPQHILRQAKSRGLSPECSHREGWVKRDGLGRNSATTSVSRPCQNQGEQGVV